MACQCAVHEHQESATSAERVRYFPRQLLTADDMRTEQDYFREKLRRHNRLLHGSGVVCGLEVIVNAKAGPLVVSVCPGYALGPWGDEIWVEESVPLDLTYCARPKPMDCDPSGVVQPIAGPKKLLVQIRYVECKSRPMRTLPAGCGCDDTACEYSRLRDGFELRCIPAPKPGAAEQVPAAVNPRVPACVPCSTDPWIVLAEVQTGANEFVINNEVRPVVPNTPSLLGL